MNRKQLLLLVLISVTVLAFFALDLQRYLGLEAFRAEHEALTAKVQSAPMGSALLFALVYIVVTALSLPGAAVLTLVAGALFGLVWGTVIVSFASSLGATLAFLFSRFLLRDTVSRYFGNRLEALDRGLRTEGPFYLFTLRLIPVFPFVLVNLLMGLTAMPTLTYYWVSQIGMLPGTVAYVNAGTQLGKMTSMNDILTPALIASFVLLGIFPWIARRFVEWLRWRKLYQTYPPPPQFDNNVVVIGAGAAGLVSAYVAATLKASVTLVEKHKMGGDCLNYGCVPSKALIRSARLAANLSRAGALGLSDIPAKIDFPAVMARVHRIIAAVEPHDSVARYTDLGVKCVSGEARVRSPWLVEVDGTAITTRAIVIAAGSAPAIPDLPGLQDCPYFTSETLWNLRVQPTTLTVLGGGPIGCELGQAFAQLGVKVTLIQRQPRLLMREDEEVSASTLKALQNSGVEVLVNATAKHAEVRRSQPVLIVNVDGQDREVASDTLLIAVGRKPRSQHFGLEALGVELNKDGTIAVDPYLRTNVPNVFACGDVAGPFQFTHVAAHQAWYASINALLGQIWRLRADYSVLPFCTFVDPEIARVGHNELSAREANTAYEVTRFEMQELDRAIIDDATDGYIKVLTDPGSDRLLGVTIVGARASELIAEFTLAMRHGLGLGKILGTVHAYPTYPEANKYVAGIWKKAHAPQQLLNWLERYHAWRRSE